MFIRNAGAAFRQPISKRFLNTETAPALYTSHAVVSGGRNGHAEGDEGLKVDLTMPSSLGGQSGTGKTNPEELFAAGYAACFQSAMGAVAPGLKIAMPEKPEDCVVDSQVSLVGDFKQLDLGLRVEMEVKARGIKKEDLEKVVAKAKEVCPYSRATNGNVATIIKVSML